MAWLAACLTSLLAVFGTVCCQDDKDLSNCPSNVNVTTFPRMLKVRWEAPTQNLDQLVSYRVKVNRDDDNVGRRVHIIPKADDLHQSFGGLEPNVQYRVQVTANFEDSNLTCNSEALSVVIRSHAKPGFLSHLWDQRLYVLIGAVAMVVLGLFVLPCICCCYYCYRNKRRSASIYGRMSKKDIEPTSAVELQSRNRNNAQEGTADDEFRFVKETGRDFNAHGRSESSFGSTSTHLTLTANSPPPSYSHSTMRSQRSVALDQVPERPPMPPPREGHDDFDSDPEDDDYQNDVFRTPPPPPPIHEASLYGNI